MEESVTNFNQEDNEAVLVEGLDIENLLEVVIKAIETMFVNVKIEEISLVR